MFVGFRSVIDVRNLIQFVGQLVLRGKYERELVLIFIMSLIISFDRFCLLLFIVVAINYLIF